MSLTKEMKARRAKEILEDDVFLEVVAKAKSSLIGQWSLTELTDTATRESLYHQDRGLRSFKTSANIDKRFYDRTKTNK